MGISIDTLKEQWRGQVPLQRFAQPKEIAEAVLFLLQSSYVHGVSLAVDGGRLRSI